nr:hypothetical protein [Tanacetum cinerariifolium]
FFRTGHHNGSHNRPDARQHPRPGDAAEEAQVARAGPRGARGRDKREARYAAQSAMDTDEELAIAMILTTTTPASLRAMML